MYVPTPQRAKPAVLIPKCVAVTAGMFGKLCAEVDASEPADGGAERDRLSRVGATVHLTRARRAGVGSVERQEVAGSGDERRRHRGILLRDR